MRARIVSVVSLLLVLSLPVQAVGTLTQASAVGPGCNSSVGICRYTFAATSDVSGDVSGNAKDLGAGRLIQVRVVPDGGGTQPSDLFDLTITDPHGIDVLNGEGANASNALGKYFLGDPPVYLQGGNLVDFVIANLGNAKGVTITVWVERP